MHIKKGDMVVVIAGRDKGKMGKVIRALPDENKVMVERVNLVSKHQKKTRLVIEEGIIKKEAAIDVSKVMLLDGKTNRPTRIQYQIREGKKVRVAVKSGTVFD